MPKNYATDVTASLAIRDLQETLSNNMFSFNGGTKAQADAARVQRVFSFADKLCERPIGTTGIVQFIGVHEDMPLYMVEAKTKTADPFKQATDIDVGDQTTFSSDDSPLTSLGATPTPTQQSFAESLPNLPPPAQPTLEAIASLAESHNLQDKVQAARDWLHAASAKALVLDINLSDRSFLPQEKAPPTNRSLLLKDLKIEVFVNGQLAEVAMIHGEMRRTTQHAPKGTVRISGTRIHRQVEKAWTYSQEASDPRLLPDNEDAERRWNAVSLSHVIEADLRGRDRYGDRPPSADFLKALAGLRLPHEMEARQGLGIIDVVITAGKGSKYGPETSYLMKPTRMDDARYTTYQPADSEEVQTVLSFPQLSDTTATELLLNPAPDQRTSSRVRNASSRAPKKVIDLTKEIGSRIDLDKTIIDTYVASHGKLVKGRTLRQKLGDIKKMKPSSMEKELAILKEKYGASEPAQKKQKISVGVGVDAGSDVFTSTPERAADAAKTLNEGKQLQPSANPEAYLPQSQIDAVPDKSAKSLIPLGYETASASPQTTPKRITKASALAGSPTHTPVKLKPPPRMAALSKSLDRDQTDVGSSPVSKRKAVGTVELDGSSTSQSKEAQAKPPKKKSAEQSVSETMEAFEVPDCCKGSCVSYDEDASAARLTGKARGGEFREESILVGMRFVVI